jgi:hypothetical protein
MARSWGGELPDWALEPHASGDEDEEGFLADDAEASVLFPEDSGGGGGGPEFAAQNVLAAVLLAASALAAGSVTLKLVLVGAALAAAAFRYIAIGLLLLAALAIFS